MNEKEDSEMRCDTGKSPSMVMGTGTNSNFNLHINAGLNVKVKAPHKINQLGTQWQQM